ncbi:MAG: pantetheine-phosphate adenylyltransferase, partial [Oscillospiraceae bacterium]
PVTVGHIDIITRAAKLFDKVIVVVLYNPIKNPSFSVEERVELLNLSLKGLKNIEVDTNKGLLAEYAKEKKASAIAKGLRAVSDYEYEFQMALTNKVLNEDVETIFLTTSAEHMYLSSSIVKQVAQFGGDIEKFVPAPARDIIIKKLCKK